MNRRSQMHRVMLATASTAILTLSAGAFAQQPGHETVGRDLVFQFP
jgi:hypothetical protein